MCLKILQLSIFPSGSGKASDVQGQVRRIDISIQDSCGLLGCAPLCFVIAPWVMDIGSSVGVACSGGGYAYNAELVYVSRNLMVKVPHGVAHENEAFH